MYYKVLAEGIQMTVNLDHTIETFILLGALIINIAGIIWIARHNWKRYGLLLLASGLLGSLICYIFILIKYYTFPQQLIEPFLPFPFESILTAISIYEL